MKILVSGATGFVGTPLVRHLILHGHQVLGTVRSLSKVPNEISGGLLEYRVVGDVNEFTDWSDCLGGVDCVVHLANRAHVMHDNETNSLDLYRPVNTDGTLHLARQAVVAGVKRFIFISSIKVNGESTLVGQPFTPIVKEVPKDPYALSKYKAEVGLRDLSQQTGMEIVIIRPPLIYGPDVKANFLKMIQWVQKGVPLPLGNLSNQRSLLGIENLLDLIRVCLFHPMAANQTFLVSDDCDISTTELLRKIAEAMGRSSYIFPLHPYILEQCLILLGQRRIAERLCSSLQLDISLTKKLLLWSPPYSFKDQLNKTVNSYLLAHSH